MLDSNFATVKLISSSRRSLDPERADSMVVCRDYWFSHAAMDSYRVCKTCPQPPSIQAMYKIQCSKHNS